MKHIVLLGKEKTHIPPTPLHVESKTPQPSLLSMLRGDSMKVGNTFWPNLAMKTRFFTHVLDKSPRNAYIPCEFRLAIKKQIVEYYVGFPMIFFLILRCHLMCEILHLMNCVTLKI